jgi:hypothetical protein
VIKAGEAAMCPTCNADLMVHAFPALIAARAVVNPADLKAEPDEATCFYHATKRASATCVDCGRFICALCAVEAPGGVRCPQCLAAPPASTSKPDADQASLANRRVLWDSIALGAATLPVLMVWTALPGSLAAIYISIRYWKRPSSLIPRMKRLRFVVAILLSLVELVLVGVLIWAIIRNGSAQRERVAQ